MASRKNIIPLLEMNSWFWRTWWSLPCLSFPSYCLGNSIRFLWLGLVASAIRSIIFGQTLKLDDFWFRDHDSSDATSTPDDRPRVGGGDCSRDAGPKTGRHATRRATGDLHEMVLPIHFSTFWKNSRTWEDYERDLRNLSAGLAHKFSA